MGWLRGFWQPDVDGLVLIASTENVSLSKLMGDERPKAEKKLLQDELALVNFFPWQKKSREQRAFAVAG